MFFSFHTKDEDGKWHLELTEQGDFQGVDEFKEFPILLTKGGLVMYLKKQEAEELQFLLQSALQELDRLELERWKL